MNFDNHYHEKAPAKINSIFKKHNNHDHKVNIWNEFADSGFIGVNDDDCTILPRVLPLSYLPTIKKTAYDITLFAMRLLSLPSNEIKAIIPPGPIRDFLINELEVLKYRKSRITGSFRFDMAIVGPPQKNNPPKLLEINEIGFDGLHRSSLIQKSIFNVLPELKEHLIALDTSRAEVRNMRRLGPTLTRFQYDIYNWEEETLIQSGAQIGLQINLIAPSIFKYKFDKNYPLLKSQKVTTKNNNVIIGSDFKPHSIQMGYSFELNDFLDAPQMYRSIVRSQTPQYGSFLSSLVASKIILVLFCDLNLRRKLLGSTKKLENTILPATSLEGHESKILTQTNHHVLKHIDGLGGELVFMGNEMKRKFSKLNKSKYHEWILQERTLLNLIDVNGILSKPRKVISDLGVFVHYDWSSGKFQNFEIGGFITRATNHSLKVNVSGGGIQVPVMFSKKD